MFKRIHVYDLDGVLVDTSHRYRNKADGSIDLAYWLANRHRTFDDKLLPLASQYIKDCANPEIYVILCTAREQHIRDVLFIVKRLAKPNKIIMRPVGDATPDAKLKRRALARLFNLRQFARLPRKLWEDNTRNIAALASLFTVCYHVPSNITETN